MKKKSIILVDDHELVRSGIRALLDTFSEVEVIAEANNGQQALDLTRKHAPDILLLDISLPKLNGLEVLQYVVKKGLSTKVIILSMHAGEEYVGKALSYGAAAYLIKDSAVEELALAIEAISRNKMYVSRNVDSNSIEFITQQDKNKEGLNALTPRQRQILQLIAEGHSTREIAETLNVSVKTVETHRSHLMNRLAINDVAGLVRFAIKQQLITIEQ